MSKHNNIRKSSFPIEQISPQRNHKKGILTCCKEIGSINHMEVANQIRAPSFKWAWLFPLQRGWKLRSVGVFLCGVKANPLNKSVMCFGQTHNNRALGDNLFVVHSFMLCFCHQKRKPYFLQGDKGILTLGWYNHILRTKSIPDTRQLRFGRWCEKT